MKIKLLTLLAMMAMRLAAQTGGGVSHGPVTPALATNSAAYLSANGVRQVWNILDYFPTVGGGKIATNCLMTAGGTILISSNVFTAADLNKYMMVYGLAKDTINSVTSTNCFVGIITNIINSNSVQLSVTAPFGTVALYGSTSTKWPMAVYGFDDSTNIQKFFGICASVMTNFGYSRPLYFPSDIYCIVRNPFDPNTGTNAGGVQHYNSQLYIPPIPTASVGPHVPDFDIEGSEPMNWGNTGGASYGNSVFNANAHGSVFWSFYAPASGTFQDSDQGEAVLTCKNWSDPSFTGGSPIGSYLNQNQVGFNNVHVTVQNLGFYTALDPHITALDMRGAGSGLTVENCAFENGIGFYNTVPPIYTNAYAIRAPINFNCGMNVIADDNIDNFYTGIELGEDVFIYNTLVIECYNGIQTRVGGHYCTLSGVAITGSQNSINAGTPMYGATGFNFTLKGDLTVETGLGSPFTNFWGFTNVVGINDPLNHLSADLTVQPTSGGFALNGADYCSINLLSTNSQPAAFLKIGYEQNVNGLNLGNYSGDLTANDAPAGLSWWNFSFGNLGNWLILNNKGFGAVDQVLLFSGNSASSDHYPDSIYVRNGSYFDGYPGGETAVTTPAGIVASNKIVLLGAGPYYGNGSGLTNLNIGQSLTNNAVKLTLWGGNMSSVSLDVAQGGSIKVPASQGSAQYGYFIAHVLDFRNAPGTNFVFMIPVWATNSVGSYNFDWMAATNKGFVHSPNGATFTPTMTVSNWTWLSISNNLPTGTNGLIGLSAGLYNNTAFSIWIDLSSAYLTNF